MLSGPTNKSWPTMLVAVEGIRGLRRWLILGFAGAQAMQKLGLGKSAITR